MNGIFYSPSVGGFFHEAHHGRRTLPAQPIGKGRRARLVEAPNPASKIPADAVEISAELHAALLQGEMAGRQIVAGPDGHPQLVDRPRASAEQLMTAHRRRVRALLAESAWSQAPDEPADLRTAWAAYRQSLRDLLNADDPATVTWPTAPEV